MSAARGGVESKAVLAEDADLITLLQDLARQGYLLPESWNLRKLVDDPRGSEQLSEWIAGLSDADKLAHQADERKAVSEIRSQASILTRQGLYSAQSTSSASSSSSNGMSSASPEFKKK